MGAEPTDLRIIAINKAVGAEYGRIRITNNGLGSHATSDLSGDEVEVVPIDKEITERVSYIKLDVEGAEYNTLVGARLHISKEKPVMAISVYHKLEDFHRLYSFIKNLVPEYRFALRHYEKIPTDYVLYAFV